MHENMLFHCTNQYAPKRYIDFIDDIKEPLFKEAVSISVVEWRNLKHKGYVGLVKTKTEYIIIRTLFRAEEDILKYFESCFGKEIEWETNNEKIITGLTTI